MDGEPKIAHADALRKGRRSIPFQLYLVTTVTRRREPVFQDLMAGRLLVQSLKTCTPEAETLCYVVMPDHLHWLFVLGERRSLSQVIGEVKRSTARAINRRLGRRGPLWQDGFHDRALRSDEDVKAVARYVIANPLRAGLVDNIGDYSLWDAVWL